MENTKKMYSNITKTELKSLVRKAEVFIQGRVDPADLDMDFAMSCYNPSNALAGCTDYKDHREDSLSTVKRMIREDIETRQCQRGSYFNPGGVPFDSIRVVLKRGGWSAYPHWRDGSRDFFASKYIK
jgi:hypothetical protein